MKRKIKLRKGIHLQEASYNKKKKRWKSCDEIPYY
jgi:hypothetical protein